jgi:hypothetical protein
MTRSTRKSRVRDKVAFRIPVDHGTEFVCQGDTWRRLMY